MIAEESRRRWLIRPGLVVVGPWEESPGSVGRDFLALHYPRWTPEKWALRFPRRWAMPGDWVPLAARPGKFAEGVYLDVRACYWRLLQRFGWASIYLPGRFLGQTPMPPFPYANHKVARNSLVTTAMPLHLQKFTPGRGYYEVWRSNPWLHIPLLHLVHDVLHLLAGLAWDAGAVYVHTDGYLAPTREVAAIIAARIQECGFEAVEKAAGAGWVKAVGSYRIGGKASRTFSPTGKPLAQVVRLEDREKRLLFKHLRDG